MVVKRKPAGGTGFDEHLATIDLLVDEHRAVLYGLKMAGDRVSDLEALFNLQRVYSEWTQSSVDSLAEKQRDLQKLMDSLYEGAKQHFRFEEKSLPPLLGETTMRALKKIHQMIQRQFRRVKSVLDVHFEGMNRGEILVCKSCIEEEIYNLCQMIDQHRSQEEILLQLLKGLLEAARGKRGRASKPARRNGKE